jgi:hypothetical protein
LTRREELAHFAGTRGNCLIDNFFFVPAVEAFYLAQAMAPQVRCLHNAWGLAIYTSKLWDSICNLPGERKDTPLEPALRAEAQALQGLDVERFRATAVENLLRINRNRRRRESAASRALAFQDPFTFYVVE